MIPLGIALERRRRMKGLSARRMPRIDLNDPVHQRVTVIVLGLTIVNVLIDLARRLSRRRVWSRRSSAGRSATP